MKLIFFGSSEFSIPVLSDLESSSHAIACVVTTPARKKGRGQKESPTVVHDWAESKLIKVLSPEKINKPEFVQELEAFKPDCLVVASYGKMIPDQILKLPKHYPLNIHPSLLPKYRGAAPIARQLLNGETESGITIARITSKLDAGEIILQQKVKIDDDDNGISLALRLARLGGELCLQTLEHIEKNEIVLTPQKDSESSYADKLTTQIGKIVWTKSAQEISRQVRALVPWPCAYTFFQKVRVKILDARESQVSADKKPAGSVVEINPNGSVIVQTGSGTIGLKTLHPESGKAMTAYQFALGRRLKIGDIFS